MSAIEKFIKKYKLANDSKNKDFRITVEEAFDIISEISSLKSSETSLVEIKTNLKNLENALKTQINKTQSNPNGDIDGGGFKNSN